MEPSRPLKGIDLKAQQKVVAWAAYADSVDKIEFLREIVATMGREEVSQLKRILGHRTYQEGCKKRQWIGLSWPEEKRRRLESAIELQPPPRVNELQPPLQGGELQPLPLERELQPVAEARPSGWWEQFGENFRSFDVEKVTMIKGLETGKMLAGKIAIVDKKLNIVLRKDILRKPGDFSTKYWAVKTSGIDMYDLKNGEDEKIVEAQVRNAFKSNLVVSCAGQNDFSSLHIEDNCYAGTFDLQTFYRRPDPNNPFNSQEMSLRDMWFYHKKEDFQYRLPHDCILDATITMRIFVEGYIPLKLKGGHAMEQGNVEQIDFSTVPNFKKMEKLGKFYCKPNDEFRLRCSCEYCKRYPKVKIVA